MKVSLVALILAVAPAANAEHIEPKQQPSDYPVHTTAGRFAIGAEFHGHTARTGGRTIFVESYIVVEVGLFPRGVELTVRDEHFTLRINEKQVLLAQTPQMVAASLKYPDWERRPEINAQASDGERAVILGRRQPVERFPGDRRPTEDRLPAPPRAPEPENRSGHEQQAATPDHELIADTGLPQRTATAAVGGYLYFPRRGDFKSIRSLELRYESAAGKAALKLR